MSVYTFGFLTDPLFDVAVQSEDCFKQSNKTADIEMLPGELLYVQKKKSVVYTIKFRAGHDVKEVPPNVREKIGYLAKQLNLLRIKTYHHVCGLQHVTPDEFRVFVCNPERCWEGDDHKQICLAKSVSTIFAVVSQKRYLNWQNYELLEEIIEEYGDSILKGKLKSYCQDIAKFEKDTSLENIRNIIFTPLGPNRYLMKIPLNGFSEPTGATLRSFKDGLKKKGCVSYYVHHISQNSPLAIFFVVPLLLVPPISKTKDSEEIYDRIIYTLSKEEILQLLDVSYDIIVVLRQVLSLNYKLL